MTQQRTIERDTFLKNYTFHKIPFLMNPAVSYFIKAVILVTCFMLVGKLAPYMPPAVLPCILIAYALVSTIGALYFTVVNRLRKQYELADDGKLSHFNKRWTLRLIGLFILSLVSGFIFILESPRWDDIEWLLTWCAIPLYYLVFRGMQHIAKKEYDIRFHKARAMRWSFYIVGILLCLTYVLLASLQGASFEPSSLEEAFQSTPKPYESAPSALMSEIDKVSSFTDGLTSYGIARVSEASLIPVLVFRFIAYGSIFFGFVNQFGACLLNKVEIRSEFQLLPTNGELESQMPFVKKYILVIASISIVASGLFAVSEFKIDEIRATNEYTQIDALVTDWTHQALFIADGSYEKAQRMQEAHDDYGSRIESIRTARNDELTPLINAYYDICISNIDSYLDWYYGVGGGAARFLKGFGNPLAKQAKTTFIESVANEADISIINNRYREYQGRISTLQAELYDTLKAPSLPDATFTSDDALDLWQPLHGPDESIIVSDILLNTDNISRDELKGQLTDLIESARTDTFATLYKN